MDTDEMVENNNNISMSDKNNTDVSNDVVVDEDNTTGVTAINGEGVNDNMDNAAQRFCLGTSLHNTQNARYNFRNHYEREFQYMQKSVKIFVGLQILKGRQD